MFRVGAQQGKGGHEVRWTTLRSPAGLGALDLREPMCAELLS